ncbi:MAG TPA: hypothetical protein VEK57_02510, partial [Thermoanaerobaculia bacterium]|nr:hypothetical protein [Thermoanaerobaculia bacterium]
MIALLFALGAACFALSLPITGTHFGAKLRQAAGVSFVLALVPSLVVGLFLPSGATPTGDAPTNALPVGAQLVHGLSCFGALVLLSLGAYG